MGWRVPAYPRFAPLLKPSLTSACPMPRFPPVTTTFLSLRLIGSAPLSRCSQNDRGSEKESSNAAARVRPAEGVQIPVLSQRDRLVAAAVRSLYHGLRSGARAPISGQGIHVG